MKRFNLPDMGSTFKTNCTYILDKKSYNFQFTWCESFFLLDISILIQNEEKFLLKGYPVVTDCDLLSRVKQPELIKGELYIVNKFKENFSPTPDTIGSNFELVFYSENDIS